MNIHELEDKTGITKQNIRFYEKKGLLHPERNRENNYREYKEKDVATLKMVKLLRKLDVPIEDIRKILEREEALDASVSRHMNTLLEQRRELDAVIKMCRILTETSYDDVDVDDMLSRMDDLERKGGKFMEIVNDYKKYAKAMSQKEFRFVPDNMLLTEKEFTEALLKYAKENHLDMVITREGLSPIFEIDGIEYQARRIYGRFGAVAQCTMTHPELLDELKDMSGERKKRFGLFYRVLPVLAVFFGVIIYLAVSRGVEKLGVCLLALLPLFIILWWVFGKYNRFRD